MEILDRIMLACMVLMVVSAFIMMIHMALLVFLKRSFMLDQKPKRTFAESLVNIFDLAEIVLVWSVVIWIVSLVFGGKP